MSIVFDEIVGSVVESENQPRSPATASAEEPSRSAAPPEPVDQVLRRLRQREARLRAD